MEHSSNIVSTFSNEEIDWQSIIPFVIILSFIFFAKIYLAIIVYSDRRDSEERCRDEETGLHVTALAYTFCDGLDAVGELPPYEFLTDKGMVAVGEAPPRYEDVVRLDVNQ